MVVSAAWPGATLEDTLSQVTERIERKLQETRNLDRVRSYTTAGITIMFVELLQSTRAPEMPPTSGSRCATTSATSAARCRRA